jgi:hypothetical protein
VLWDAGPLRDASSRPRSWNSDCGGRGSVRHRASRSPTRVWVLVPAIRRHRDWKGRSVIQLRLRCQEAAETSLAHAAIPLAAR